MPAPSASRRAALQSSPPKRPGELWKPYPTQTLIAMRRCPDCGWHPETMGHHPDCPATQASAEESSDTKGNDQCLPI